jgi:hypothetical protein
VRKVNTPSGLQFFKALAVTPIKVRIITLGEKLTRKVPARYRLLELFRPFQSASICMVCKYFCFHASGLKLSNKILQLA